MPPDDLLDVPSLRALERTRKSLKAAWVTAIVIGTVLLLMAGAIAYAYFNTRVAAEEQWQPLKQEHPLLPPGVSIKPVDKPVVGDLGGMPVTFPPGFVRNVEYDGDPGWGEKREGAIPKRTHQSALVSLGFEVRYPEFAVTSWKERREDQRKYSIYNTPWLSVGMIAGPIFGDGQYLERSLRSARNDGKLKYKKLSENQFDLEVYTPTAVDKSLRNYHHKYGYRSDISDRDLFFYFNSTGKVDAFIRCSNRNHDAAPCRHVFYLDPELRVEVSVSYRRGMLEHWRVTQESVKKMILESRFREKNYK